MNPKSIQELTEQIEELLAQYIAESQRAAQQALERAFATAPGLSTKSTKSTKLSKSSQSTAKPSKRTYKKRRSPEELIELGAQLVELVRARPGESMVTFAAELGVSSRDLERPMLRLKREGRVRSVGERHSMRYFPTMGVQAARGAA
jgi:hypothetical protein